MYQSPLGHMKRNVPIVIKLDESSSKFDINTMINFVMFGSIYEAVWMEILHLSECFLVLLLCPHFLSLRPHNSITGLA